MFYTSSRFKAGKPSAFDGSRAGFAAKEASPTAWYRPQYSQTVTLVTGAISQLNDISGNSNNATQGTAANRPLLSRADNKENRVINSNNYTTTPWATKGAGVDKSTTYIANPIDGALDMAKVVDVGSSSTEHRFNQSISLYAGLNATFGIWAVPDERTWIYLRLYDGTTTKAAWFNLSGTGSLGTVESGVTASIEKLNGYYHCKISWTPTASGSGNVLFAPVLANNGSQTYTSVAGEGLYVYNPELAFGSAEIGSLDPTTTYAKLAGINGNAVMSFDGSDDSLTTSLAVNPTGGMWGIAVVRLNAISGTNTIMAAWTSSANARLQWIIDSAGRPNLYVQNGNSVYIGRLTASAALAVNEVAVLSFTYDGGTSSSGIKLYKNGIQNDTTNGNSGSYTVPTSGENIVIGTNGAGSNRLNGFIGEVIYGQGSTLSDVRHASIVGSLMDRFGI